MSRLTAVWVSLILTAVSAPALSHHSFSATYIVDKQVTIKGTVVHVQAPDKDGKMVTCAVEWGAGGSLGSDNITRDTIKPGDKVIIKGNPARDESSQRIRMHSIERSSDGFKWEGTFG